MTWEAIAEPIVAPGGVRMSGSLAPTMTVREARPTGDHDVYVRDTFGNRIPPWTNKMPAGKVQAEKDRLLLVVNGPLCNGCETGCWWCSESVRAAARAKCCPHCSGTGIRFETRKDAT